MATPIPTSVKRHGLFLNPLDDQTLYLGCVWVTTSLTVTSSMLNWAEHPPMLEEA